MYSAVRALNSDPIPAKPARVLRGAVRSDLLRDELLCEIFAATARARPDAIALITAGGKLTYAELDRRAEALARGLIRQGVGPGRVVGLWLPRGCELLISQIAIAKTGAAWLPFDADAPIDRIATCLEDAEAVALLSAGPRAETARAKPACPVLTAVDLVDAADQTPVDARALGATPDHPAYLIYTSGSTGVPKGIAISGRNICHFLRAANEIYRLDESDVVFQGASVAFDLSMEEIWLPYLVGATLFVASPEIMGETDRLPEMLEANGVTVLDTVPTLLSVLPRDVASLRLVILGGEACPPTLASQWCRPGRKIFNSYGPTEATVVATIAEVRIGETVTIGTPIPNYTCYVVDAGMGLLGMGEEGELLIGGPGVAKGYLNRSALTAEKFIANPFADLGGDPVLYRSGDAAIIDHQGNLQFRGRIDDQVKIRGFRVELGEIEAKLGESAGVESAAVILRHHDGLDELTAFIVPTRGAAVDSKLLRSELRAKLPAYMVPSRFETLAALPTLVSGKVDRNSLKKLELVPLASTEAQEEPRNETEAALLAAAKRVLPPQPIPLDADFFTDLGGHSLLAARFVSLVRETPALAAITLQDVYAARSLRAIAELLQGKLLSQGDGGDLSFTPPPWRRRFLCGLAQAAAMPFILSLIAVQWLGVFMSYMLFTGVDASLFEEIVTIVAVYVAIEVAILAIVIAAKWLLLGRTKPGRYPLWGTYFYRWWLSERLLSLIQTKTFQGTPIMRFYLRALGAKVGKDVLIGDISCGAHDLISIGDRASIGANATFANARVEGNELIIGWIEVGADAQIGSSCALEEDVVVGDGTELHDLTAVPAGSRIGAWEIWDGSPASKTGTVDRAELAPFASAGRVRKAVMATMYAVLLLAVPPLTLIPILAGFWAFNRIDDLIGVADMDKLLYLASIPVISWPTAFVMVVVTVGFIIAFRWLVLPKVTEGIYSVHSWFYLRKWAVALATEATLDTLSSLYATIYMQVWYRLMGAKIGKGAEISTNFAGRYDLVEIGEKCFIADEVVLGDEEIRRGYMILKKVKTGPRVFVGNSAVVPPGADIPANALIGIKSKPPANELMSRGDTWFGSPPIKLPVRQTFDVGGAWTYEPPWWKKLARACFEAVTISLPVMLFITFGTWAVEWLAQPLLSGAYGEFVWSFVAAAVMISLGLCGVVVALKWVTMGRYEPVTKPMWSWWAMRTEAVAVIYAGLAGRMLLEHLRGTPFLPWIWRLLGAKVGRGVFVDMTDITEFDCVSIGDFSALNAGAALQTHLYEDRVMKVGRVNVGCGVTVGAGSTVLYDTVVANYARLGPLTVVMKGEYIPPDSEWIGSPAQPKAVAMVIEEKVAA